MFTSINIILFIIGVFLYLRKPVYAPIYYLFWCSFFAFAIDIVFPLQVNEETYKFNTFSILYIFFCGFLHITRNLQHYWKNDFSPLLLSLLLIFYLVFLTYYRGNGTRFLSFFLPWFTILPVWLILLTEEVDWEKYEKFLRYAIILELVLGLSQYLLGLGYSSFVEEYAENGAENVVGTFRRYNAFADNMSLLILSTLAIRLVKEVRISVVDYVLMAVGYVLVFYSGARTELAALSLAIILLFFARYRHNFKALAVLSVLLVIVGARVVQGTGEEINRSEVENNEQRQFQAINAIGDSENVYLEEQSTFALSILLWNEYISSDNYLFGPGKLFENQFGYLGLVCEGGAMYDSFLALFLCETGLIGVVLLVLILITIIRSCQRPSYALAILAYLFIVSFTDFGLFQGNSAIFLFLCIGYINKFEEEINLGEDLEISENELIEATA